MDIKVFEKSEEELELCEKVLQAEKERLNKAKTKTIIEAKKILQERVGKIH